MKKNTSKRKYWKYFSIKHNKGLFWVIKITIITFAIAVLCSFLSQWASKSGTLIAVTLLISLIAISIFFDGLGVSVTRCSRQDLVNYCKNYNCNTIIIAYNILENAEKVNNICSDVVGDMCGILSGACGITIVVNLCKGSLHEYLFSVLLSSLVAAITVGGKAFMKGIALSHCAKLVMLTSKILNCITPRKKTNGKKKINGNSRQGKLSSRHKDL